MLKMNDDEEEFKLTLGYEIFTITYFPIFFFFFLKKNIFAYISIFLTLAPG